MEKRVLILINKTAGVGKAGSYTLDVVTRFAKAGYTEVYIGDETEGPARKYHRITAAGRKYLSEQTGIIKNIVDTLTGIGVI